MNIEDMKNNAINVPQLSIDFGSEKITVAPNTPEVVAFLETAAYNTLELCRDNTALKEQLEAENNKIEELKSDLKKAVNKAFELYAENIAMKPIVQSLGYEISISSKNERGEQEGEEG